MPCWFFPHVGPVGAAGRGSPDRGRRSGTTGRRPLTAKRRADGKTCPPAFSQAGDPAAPRQGQSSSTPPEMSLNWMPMAFNSARMRSASA